MAQHSHDDSTFTVSAPVHPVPQLQAPFEESMLESTYDDADAGIYLDPITRRNTLLEAPTYIRVVAGRWKQKPGERFHPLWKLIAQVSFGVHLLAEGMAKSEDDVMQILQAHVDEIDGFLERTTEDFNLAQEDIQERLRCLKLPLSHPATFDKMLEDRNFRLSIVDGNEKIEHIVERTSQSMKDSMKDVQKGYESTSCLESYLQDLARTWYRISVEHEAVFVAMLGNVEGWRKTFTALHMQGNKLNSSLKKLTDIINEMQARAGEVSRRLLHQAKVQPPQVTGRSSGRSTPTSRFQAPPAKVLPGMPNRPPLRQVESNDAMPTAQSTRTSSHETLRRQAILARSQSPQSDLPTPKSVRTVNSPRVIQVRTNSPARVQSMVPSLLGTTSPTKDVPPPTNSERQFPPVELPAHVPEETMQNAPMSEQGRLSMGVSTLQRKPSIDQTNSTLGTSTLIDLLRSAPTVTKPSHSDKPKSPDASRQGLITNLNGATNQATSTNQQFGRRGFPLNSLPHRSSSPEVVTSAHSNTSIRRPQKGTQPWFDAEHNSSINDAKFSIHGNDDAEKMTSTVKELPQPLADQSSQPGTPAWAVTTFAQAEKKKELLKQGAFRSHPPELPFGSPPMTQNGLSPKTISGVGLQRRPSHSSSTGHSTLGEPGPEVAASEAGSVSATSGRHRHQDPRRASAYAPEVVAAQALPPLPQSRKHFVAEMEGSSPSATGGIATTKGIVMELEAPHRHFVLPPRPQSSTPFLTNTSPAPYQQHFVLPPRSTSSQPRSAEALVQPETEPKSVTAAVQEIEPKLIVETPAQVIGSIRNRDLDTHDYVDSKAVQPEGSYYLEAAENVASMDVAVPDLSAHSDPGPDAAGQGLKPVVVDNETPEQVDSEVVEQFANYEDGLRYERLPSSVYVSTPNIPIPPSPLNDLKTGHLTDMSPKSAVAEPLYILQALTYQAPRNSSGLLPGPARRSQIQEEDESEREELLPSRAENRIKQEYDSTPSDETPPNAARKTPSEQTTHEPVNEIRYKSVSDVLSTTECKSETTLGIPPQVVSRDSLQSTTQGVSGRHEDGDQTAVLPIAKPGPGIEDYDPYRTVDDTQAQAMAAMESGRNSRAVKVAPLKIVSSTAFNAAAKQVVISPKSTRSSSSQSSTTRDWKAFFKGQPSPVGSNLSIRSIKRESYIEQQAQSSPALLSPASASSKHLFPPSPVGAGAKEAVWFSVGSNKGPNASDQTKETIGLGIMAINDDDAIQHGSVNVS